MPVVNPDMILVTVTIHNTHIKLNPLHLLFIYSPSYFLSYYHNYSITKNNKWKEKDTNYFLVPYLLSSLLYFNKFTIFSSLVWVSVILPLFILSNVTSPSFKLSKELVFSLL